MRRWGDKLYQNDLAQDLKEEYRTYLKIGYSDLEVENMMIDSFEEELDEKENERIFWLVLADQEFKLGRLSSKVKKKALSYLKNTEIKELIELKNRIESEPLERKKMGKFYMKRSQYNVGDVLSYKINASLSSDKLVNSDLIDKYVLFEVTGMVRLNIGYLQTDEFYNEYPVVTLLDWIGNEMPDKEQLTKIQPKKRKNSDEKTINNYLPVTIEDGIVKWKKKDFDTIQYVLALSKKEIKELNISRIYENNTPEYIEVSCAGRPFLNNKNLNNIIILDFE